MSLFSVSWPGHSSSWLMWDTRNMRGFLSIIYSSMKRGRYCTGNIGPTRTPRPVQKSLDLRTVYGPSLWSGWTPYIDTASKGRNRPASSSLTSSKESHLKVHQGKGHQGNRQLLDQYHDRAFDARQGAGDWDTELRSKVVKRWMHVKREQREETADRVYW